MSASAELDEGDIAASVLLPHFRAVQDVFAAFVPEPGRELDLARKVRYVVDPKIRNSDRHYAATREDGRLMMFAPEIVDLDLESLTAILAHEFGHALDFLYPARWYQAAEKAARAYWIASGDTDTKTFRKWEGVWRDRHADAIEWAADGIAWQVTGRAITYCGDCMIQCFSGGQKRPKGLR